MVFLLKNVNIRDRIKIKKYMSFYTEGRDCSFGILQYVMILQVRLETEYLEITNTVIFC